MTEYKNYWFNKYHYINSNLMISNVDFIKLTNILKSQNEQNVVQNKIAQIESEYLEKLKV
jgi:hypothetical protein